MELSETGNGNKVSSSLNIVLCTNEEFSFRAKMKAGKEIWFHKWGANNT